MKGMTFMTREVARTRADVSDYGPREPVGTKRYARRQFWRAHRRSTKAIIVDQMDMGFTDPVANVFTAMAQSDAEQAYLWDEEDKTEARLIALRKKREWLYDMLYDTNESIEANVDHLFCVQQGFCCCYRNCL